MNKLSSQKIELVLCDPGDWSVGIRELNETVTITFEYGGWDDDLISDLTTALKDTFKEVFDIQSVITLKQYKDDIQKENEIFLRDVMSDEEIHG